MISSTAYIIRFSEGTGSIAHSTVCTQLLKSKPVTNWQLHRTYTPSQCMYQSCSFCKKLLILLNGWHWHPWIAAVTTCRVQRSFKGKALMRVLCCWMWWKVMVKWWTLSNHGQEYLWGCFSLKGRTFNLAQTMSATISVHWRITLICALPERVHQLFCVIAIEKKVIVIPSICQVKHC